MVAKRLPVAVGLLLTLALVATGPAAAVTTDNTFSGDGESVDTLNGEEDGPYMQSGDEAERGPCAEQADKGPRAEQNDAEVDGPYMTSHSADGPVVGS